MEQLLVLFTFNRDGSVHCVHECDRSKVRLAFQQGGGVHSSSECASSKSRANKRIRFGDLRKGLSKGKLLVRDYPSAKEAKIPGSAVVYHELSQGIEGGQTLALLPPAHVEQEGGARVKASGCLPPADGFALVPVPPVLFEQEGEAGARPTGAGLALWPPAADVPHEVATNNGPPEQPHRSGLKWSNLFSDAFIIEGSLGNQRSKTLDSFEPDRKCESSCTHQRSTMAKTTQGKALKSPNGRNIPPTTTQTTIGYGSNTLASANFLRRTPARKLQSCYHSEDVELDLKNMNLDYPSLVRHMIRSNVTTGFWLGIPAKFCREYLPQTDQIVVLEDVDGLNWDTNYLAQNNCLSAGWKSFAVDHRLKENDSLVFKQVKPLKFKVFITRASERGSAPDGRREVDTKIELVQEREPSLPFTAHEPMTGTRAKHLGHEGKGGKWVVKLEIFPEPERSPIMDRPTIAHVIDLDLEPEPSKPSSCFVVMDHPTRENVIDLDLEPESSMLSPGSDQSRRGDDIDLDLLSEPPESPSLFMVTDQSRRGNVVDLDLKPELFEPPSCFITTDQPRGENENDLDVEPELPSLMATEQLSIEYGLELGFNSEPLRPSSPSLVVTDLPREDELDIDHQLELPFLMATEQTSKEDGLEFDVRPESLTASSRSSIVSDLPSEENVIDLDREPELPSSMTTEQPSREEGLELDFKREHVRASSPLLIAADLPRRENAVGFDPKPEPPKLLSSACAILGCDAAYLRRIPNLLIPMIVARKEQETKENSKQPELPSLSKRKTDASDLQRPCKKPHC